jgi:hypothetical protein
MKSVSSRTIFLFAILAAIAVFVAFFVILNTSHVDREVVPAKQALEDVQDKKQLLQQKQSVIKRQQGSGKNGRAQSGLTRSQRAPAIAGSFAKSNYLDHRSQEDDNPDDVAPESSSNQNLRAVHATIAPQTVIKPSALLANANTDSKRFADDYYMADDSTEPANASNSSVFAMDDAGAYYGDDKVLTNKSSTSPKQGVNNLIDLDDLHDDKDAEDDDHIREHISSAMNLSASTVSSSSSSKSNSSACKNPSYPPLCDMYDYVRFWRHKFHRPQVGACSWYYCDKLLWIVIVCLGLLCLAGAGS